jgi:hypothetical protein
LSVGPAPKELVVPVKKPLPVALALAAVSAAPKEAEALSEAIVLPMAVM